MTTSLRFIDGARAFGRDAKGVSAVEFAFVAPALLVLLVAGFDCGRLVYASAKAESVANQIAQMMAQTPKAALPVVPATVGDGVVASSDILGFYNAAPFIYPDVINQAAAQGVAWDQVLKLDLANVAFTAKPAGCKSNCTYVPKVAWNYGDSAYLRACGSTITGVSDTSATNPGTLPTDSFGPNSLLVVDVHYAWTPTFGAGFLGGVTLARSIYLNPRYVPNVEATSGNGVNICP